MTGRGFCYRLVAFTGVMFLAATVCHAGWISEISRLPRTVDSPPAELPAYVELSNMQSRPQAELIVINARDNLFHGRILNITAIDQDPTPPAQVPAVQIVADDNWPADVYPGQEPSLITSAASPLFNTAASNALSVILVSGTSHLQVGNTLSRPDQLHADATLLDAVTFTVGVQPARAFAGESIIDAANAGAMIRPLTGAGFPADTFLKGMADPRGNLIGVDPGYRLSPGRLNSVWPADIPEPSVLAILLAAGLALPARRIGR